MLMVRIAVKSDCSLGRWPPSSVDIIGIQAMGEQLTHAGGEHDLCGMASEQCSSMQPLVVHSDGNVTFSNITGTGSAQWISVHYTVNSPTGMCNCRNNGYASS